MKKNVIMVGATLFLAGTYFYVNPINKLDSKTKKSIVVDSTVTPIDTNQKTTKYYLPKSTFHSLEKEKARRKEIRETYLKNKLKKTPKA